MIIKILLFPFIIQLCLAEEFVSLLGVKWAGSYPKTYKYKSLEFCK